MFVDAIFEMAESACAQVGVAVSGASTDLSHSLTNVLMTFAGWLMKWKVDVEIVQNF